MAILAVILVMYTIGSCRAFFFSNSFDGKCYAQEKIIPIQWAFDVRVSVEEYIYIDSSSIVLCLLSSMKYFVVGYPAVRV